MKIYTIFDETHCETLSFGFLSITKAINWIADDLMKDDELEVRERLWETYGVSLNADGEELYETLYEAIEDGIFEDIYGIRTIEVEE